MSRRGKIIFAMIAIILSFISFGISLWLFVNSNSYTVTSGYIMQFFLMVTPTMVVLAMINLLRKDK